MDCNAEREVLSFSAFFAFFAVAFSVGIADCGFEQKVTKETKGICSSLPSFASVHPSSWQMALEQFQISLDLGDGFLGEAALGARAADFRLHFVFLDGGQKLESFQVQFQLFALDFDPLPVVVAPAQGHQIPAQTVQRFQFLGGILRVGGGVPQGGGQARGQAKGQLVGQLRAARLAELGGLGLELECGFEGSLMVLPIAVSAQLPIGEVVVVDRLAVKFRRHEGCYFGQGVKPFGDFYALFAIFEPVVDLLADGLRQPRYFASSCHKNFLFLAGLTWINLD